MLLWQLDTFSCSVPNREVREHFTNVMQQGAPLGIVHFCICVPTMHSPKTLYALQCQTHGKGIQHVMSVS